MQLSYFLLRVVAVVFVLLTVGSDAKKCLDKCRKKNSGNYAACRRCTEYVTCNKKKVMTTTPCPEGDEWNHDTETCEPGPSATCQPVPGDMRYCDPPQSRACVYDCSRKADGDYPSCRKCTEFVSCSNGLLYYMPCPANLEWDDRQYVRRCEYHLSPTCPKPLVLTATCDNIMALYIDGVLQAAPAGELTDWRTSSTFSMSDCTRLLAISCLDNGVAGGTLASVDNGMVTDSTWRCSDTLEAGWELPGFVESPGVWQSATNHGTHGVKPWYIVGGIDPAAKWIWTSDNTTPRGKKTTYCRKEFSREDLNCTPVALTATCDNSMTLYIDGVLQDAPAGELNVWRETSTFSMSECTQLLAISCLDLGTIGGTLASADNGMVTDSTWRCSDTLEAGWEMPEFVESPGVWQSATDHGTNGVMPWGMVDGIDPAAKWIWTRDNVTPQGEKTTYCRREYSREDFNCPPFALTATCDNSMTLYIDGVLQDAPAGELNEWKKTSTFSMSDCTELLAISCLDLGTIGGTLASADNGMVTDSTWRCSDTLEAGWELPGFVESPGVWQSATDHGTNGINPWGMVGGIDPAAKWIWTSENVPPKGGKTTYCRKEF